MYVFNYQLFGEVMDKLFAILPHMLPCRPHFLVTVKTGFLIEMALMLINVSFFFLHTHYPPSVSISYFRLLSFNFAHNQTVTAI